MRKPWDALTVGLMFGLSGCGYKTLQSNDEQTEASWAGVVNQYQRRVDLIHNPRENAPSTYFRNYEYGTPNTIATCLSIYCLRTRMWRSLPIAGYTKKPALGKRGVMR